MKGGDFCKLVPHYLVTDLKSFTYLQSILGFFGVHGLFVLFFSLLGSVDLSDIYLCNRVLEYFNFIGPFTESLLN